MAEVKGHLREDKATYGEKVVLKHLADHLPKEFTVYVEFPISDSRIQRYPDFAVLANYGVVVLEVKDWVNVESFDRFTARIRTRKNEVREEKNPVSIARDYCTSLTAEFQRMKTLLNDRQALKVAWGYAVVFPNLHGSTLSRLKKLWGEDFVLGLADLSPDLILKRLKSTIATHHIRTLTRSELDCIRGVLNPTIVVHPSGRLPVILDQSQETLVSEPVRPPSEISTADEAHPVSRQEVLLPREEPLAGTATQTSEPEPPFKRTPPTLEELASQTAVRLVRGVAGSGKTLVLTQRARYLAARYPEWRILVLTFNDKLKDSLADSLFRCSNIRVCTFYGLCRQLMSDRIPWKNPITSEGWLKHHRDRFPLVDELGVEFLQEEFKWLMDTLTLDRAAYLSSERKGRGLQRRLGKQLRSRVFDIFEAYRACLQKEKLLDWVDIPRLVLDGVLQGQLPVEPYHAILIDEAQDFAPAWFRLINHNLVSGGALFLADDPAQSIYRYFSWREKGIEVVGRTRHLRVPYRNTYEIYQAAFELIRSDEALRHQFEEEGQIVLPDLDPDSMQHGKKPILRRFSTFAAEAGFILEQVRSLSLLGIRGGQIAVLNRHRKGKAELQKALKGLDINIDTYHQYKGLEFEAVFLTGIQDAFPPGADPQKLSEERRLVYMAMTRARRELVLTGCGPIPQPLRCILPHVDQV